MAKWKIVCPDGKSFVVNDPVIKLIQNSKQDGWFELSFLDKNTNQFYHHTWEFWQGRKMFAFEVGENHFHLIGQNQEFSKSEIERFAKLSAFK